MKLTPFSKGGSEKNSFFFFIFANLSNIWFHRLQLDSHIWFCIHLVVMCYYEENCPHRDMWWEKKGLDKG